MVKYRCSNCNYVFEPKVKDRIPTRCPYCSTTGKLVSERSLLDRSLKEDVDDDME